MKKFKLIEDYPGSPKVGTEIVESMIIGSKPKFKTFTISGKDINCDMGKFRLEDPENYPKYWEEIIDKNYEILSFRNNEPEGFRMYTKLQRDGSYTCDGSVNGATEKWCFDEGYKIHSVKRLSDGEIFTVGDYIIVDFLKGNVQTIKIRDNDCWFYTNDKNCLKLGNYITLKKESLFTTEDGVDIFEGDKFYISKLYDWKLIPCKAIKNATFSIDNSKKFSTKEAAEEYILRNKPCLSVNDICKMVEKVRGNDSFNDSNFNKDLVKLVKKKLDYDN